MTATEIRQESLRRAQSSESYANYGAIIDGFMAKGIPAVDIAPRVNIFTFNAWKALGRQVKKGEHGVRVTTFAEYSKKDKSGEEIKSKRPWHTTVFHESQTEPITVARP